MNAELEPGEIGVAVVNRTWLVKGAEYEVIAVVDPGGVHQVRSGLFVRNGLPQRAYLVDVGGVGVGACRISELRRRRSPTASWDDVEQITGWRPEPEVEPA